jgi:hypothetical protein
MSAAWDKGAVKIESAAAAKRLIRLWGYLSIAGAFLVFVASRLGISLF